MDTVDRADAGELGLEHAVDDDRVNVLEDVLVAADRDGAVRGARADGCHYPGAQAADRDAVEGRDDARVLAEDAVSVDRRLAAGHRQQDQGEQRHAQFSHRPAAFPAARTGCRSNIRIAHFPLCSRVRAPAPEDYR